MLIALWPLYCPVLLFWRTLRTSCACTFGNLVRICYFSLTFNSLQVFMLVWFGFFSDKTTNILLAQASHAYVLVLGSLNTTFNRNALLDTELWYLLAARLYELWWHHWYGAKLALLQSYIHRTRLQNFGGRLMFSLAE